MSTTKIEWAEHVWNPVTGCTKVSPGCRNCYAERFAERFRGVSGHAYEQGFDLRMWPDRMNVPMLKKYTTRYFVNSMSDLFHKDVPDEFLTQVFSVMETVDRHTYLLLTKRPERMKTFVKRELPNVWFGVSVEDQARTARIAHLLETPAAVRWISAEPMLEHLDLRAYLKTGRIHWVVCGGESGPEARPFNMDWARDLMSQCRTFDVPFFMKQMGASAHDGYMKEQGFSVPDWKKFKKKGGDPDEWPKEFRVREYPKEVKRVG